LPGGTEESHEEPVGIIGVLDKFGTQYLLTTSANYYRYSDEVGLPSS
jgi:hypothetical protein